MDVEELLQRYAAGERDFSRANLSNIDYNSPDEAGLSII